VLPRLPKYHSRFRLRRRLPKLVLLVLISLFTVLAVYSFLYGPQTPSPDRPVYGVSFDPYYAQSLGLDWQQTYSKLLDDLGVRHLRLTAHWNKIEPQPGQFFWDDLDWQMQEAEARGVKVALGVGRKLPRWPECHDPIWLESLTEEEVENELLSMIKTVVDRYHSYPNLEFWQVENEPFFPFGHCQLADPRLVKKEIDLVRSLDSRPTYTTDSGEGGTWFIAGHLGDYFGISMYRVVWFDFWGLLPPVYFKYPLPHWSYRVKAFLTQLPLAKILLVELQAEPWGDKPTPELTEAEEARTMSPTKFDQIIDYSQKAGFKRIYLWGAEWWLFKKDQGQPAYWERVRKLLID